jgi:alkanesulfonate monooxygenase SsuD/methylene tetrahydromethanopterin reductase-like flavin-dependent oxidoreductase (luciferase family)
MIPAEARYGIVLGQRASWTELLARARETETLGFDNLFLVDHFYGLKDLDDPTHEGYTMLAALAPFTQRIRLGIMVCGNTYRNPSFLLKQAITVDHVSSGRVDFGVGAGWVEREHEAYGWPFPSAKERVDMFAEALEVWQRYQTQVRTTFHGQHYTMVDAPFAPKSLQGRLPVLVGGSGPRMMRLTARYADLWNGIGTPAEGRELNARLDEACAAEGRDPRTLVRTISPSVNLLTSAAAFEEGVLAYHEAGFRDVYFPWPRVEAELPVLREVAATVLPRLRNLAPAAAPVVVPTGRAIAGGDVAALADILARLASDAIASALLGWLIDHPDTQINGEGLMRELGLERHSDVAFGFARLADALATGGFGRPWNEAQRGYTLAAGNAAILRAARVG